MKVRERTNLTAGILFTLTAGTLLHFCYEWSGKNPFIALFAPVNESVWEHLKLLFFPVFVYTLFEVIVLFKTSGGFLTARLTGVLLGMYFILSAFFTYTGILGKNVMFLDLFTFFVSVLTGFRLTFRFTRSCRGQRWETVMNLLILILFFCFLLFTYMPPKIGLFQPPV